MVHHLDFQDFWEKEGLRTSLLAISSRICNTHQVPSHLSPLRYPGGKAALADRITKALLDSHLLGGTFVEPFAGGAGVGLDLLFNEMVSSLLLNDLDPRVYAFWSAVLRYTDDFCEDLERITVSMDEWRKQKAIFENPSDYASYPLGFATFYLNRTNRSGILGGGPIGGVEQVGNYNLTARFNKPALIKRIQRLKLYRDRIETHNLDAIRFLEQRLPETTSNMLIYLDPPYFEKGKVLYRNHFTLADHQRLSAFLRGGFELPWVLSYDDVPEIEALYTGTGSHRLTLNYSAHSPKKGAEVLYFGNCELQTE